ncbi:O-antigen translocase [Enterobacter hormaechei]|uniref:O-antigen translocase n=1 Tax=Enterobacter cloacae complex TaxID=354276 RepID=UPI001887B91A|nr:O-antigen translocase [Enterobacter hormaechei]EKZ9487294.1 O-antigen translocase [Enterobacter hormaechei]MBF1949281.1 O-antigen translocase [Enterobacter hormaechei]MCE1404199.1 O-antigen translocase [Enterobacter hormaechei]MCM7058144.1 O-antigen translocase [Enterobacter hormaechei]MCV2341770.1 O-antigen translocase [Enterobacter hormaechei]
MKKIFSVTAFSALLTLTRMGSGFLISKVVALYIGPYGLAMLGQLQNLVSLVTGLVNSPVATGAVRYTSENYEYGYEKCKPWWRAISLWAALFCLVSFLFLLAFNSYISKLIWKTEEYKSVIYALAFFLPFSSIGVFITSIINGHQDYKRYISYGLISVGVSTVFMCLMIYNFRLIGAFYAAAIQLGMMGCLLILLTLKQPWCKITYFFGKIESVHLKKVFNYVLISVVGAISLPLTLILIRNFIVNHNGWVQAGYWQAVWKISEVYLAIFTTALSTYALPRLAKLHEIKEIQKEILQLAKFLCPAVILAALVILVSRDYIITFLFTEQFMPAKQLFPVQLIGDFFKIISWLFAYPVIAKGYIKTYLILEAVFAIVFIMTGYICINVFGLIGATYAYCISYIIYFLLAAFNIKYIMK